MAPRRLNSKAIVLLSGGLDSSVLLVEMTKIYKNIYPIYVQCGLNWEKVEIRYLNKYLKILNSRKIQPVTFLSCPMQNLYNSHWSVTGKNVPDKTTTDKEVYLPGRNIILVSQAAIFAAIHKISTIILGHLKLSCFPDSTDAFLRSLEKTLGKGLSWKIKIKRPFIKFKKSKVIQLGRALPLQYTLSCINPHNNKHCGECSKCEERRVGFKKAKLVDPTRYVYI